MGNTLDSANSEEGRANKKLSVFLICIAVATAFWFLIALTESYFTTLDIPVTYTNIPHDKVITNKLPSKVSVTVTGHGFSLLGQVLKRNSRSIIVDLNEIETRSNGRVGYVLTNSELNKAGNRISKEVNIQQIYPDTILMVFEPRVSKVVPVIPDLSLGLKKQFRQNGSVMVNPSTIEIWGRSQVLDMIDLISTEKKKFDEVSDTIRAELSLKLPGGVSAGNGNTKVNLMIPVDKFTENIKYIPIEVDSLPENYELRLFPDSVLVTFLVAESNYANVGSEQFRASVNFLKIVPDEESVKVELAIPEQVNVTRVEPERIKYILIK